MYTLRIITAENSEYNINFWKPEFNEIDDMNKFPKEIILNTIEELRKSIEDHGYLYAPTYNNLLKIEKNTTHLVIYKHIVNAKGEYIPEGYLITHT